MDQLYKPLAVFAVCALLAVGDVVLAGKKRGGMNGTDKRRIRGILGIGCILAAGTYVLQLTL